MRIGMKISGGNVDLEAAMDIQKVMSNSSGELSLGARWQRFPHLLWESK